MKGKTIINATVIMGFAIGWLGFWYHESQIVQAQMNDLNVRVAKVETLQPDLVNRLDRIESMLDKMSNK